MHVAILATLHCLIHDKLPFGTSDRLINFGAVIIYEHFA
jgi:hypothetical protein